MEVESLGWDLSVAEAKDVYLTESDLWRFTQQFLMNASHTTTYKHVLMKALLECTTELNESGVVSFHQIAKHVTKIYWNLIVKHGLTQMNQLGKQSAVEKAMVSFQKEHNIPQDWNFDRLPEHQQNQLIRNVNQFYKKYVYGSFYRSFNETIYSFNRKEEWIQLVPAYVVFFEKYKRILMNVTNYQLAIFLEKYNSQDAMERILSKLEFVSVRQSLDEFKQILLSHGHSMCFYCLKPVKQIHVDHFIPWSYMQNDVLWNFVLSCPTCNTSKNNRLANIDYLYNLVERNHELRTAEHMSTYKESKLIHLYHYAVQNGYENNWAPKA